MKVLLLDLGSRGDADRLRAALVQECYAVDLVTEPAAAGWLANDPAIDAVIVCAVRGDERVLDWCRRLREQERWVPVGVLLDGAEPIDVVATLDAGADDCVTRPVRFSEISARVRALTRRTPQVRPPVLTIGDLHLDPATHRVWCGEDEEIDLTPREFALLHALMRHPGRTLSRTTLLESAWDRVEDPVSNVVDQYVARLRRLLGDQGRQISLETVRGVGYRLRAA